jgi:signal transduction histidine kinase
MARRAQMIRARTRISVVGPVDADFAELDGAIESAFGVSRELIAMGQPPGSEPSIVDVNELITQAKHLVQGLLGAGIVLSLDLRAVDPVVRADTAHVEWIILNLLANARDAMPGGGVVQITTEDGDGRLGDSSAPSRRHVHVTVADTGHAIAPGVLEHVLDPFMTTRTGRTGLGLTSVAVTVRQLKGDLRIESQPGIGTSVHVYLPVFGNPRESASGF